MVDVTEDYGYPNVLEFFWVKVLTVPWLAAGKKTGVVTLPRG